MCLRIDLVGISEGSSGSTRLGIGLVADLRLPLGAELVVVVCCTVAVYCTDASCMKEAKKLNCIGNKRLIIMLKHKNRY